MKKRYAVAHVNLATTRPVNIERDPASVARNTLIGLLTGEPEYVGGTAVLQHMKPQLPLYVDQSERVYTVPVKLKAKKKKEKKAV